jgi:hypothetical protein
LTKREDIRPALEGMAKEAEDALGLVKRILPKRVISIY